MPEKNWKTVWRDDLLSWSPIDKDGGETLQDAKRVFADLDLENQRALIAETITCRSAELARAYPDLVSIMGGVGYRKNKKGNRVEKSQPCIIFVVKAKRPAQEMDKIKSDKSLPAHLFTYTGLRNQRKLCAIPTDVEDAGDIGVGKPEGSNKAIAARIPGTNTGVYGNITALIKRRVSANKTQTFALSCRHVLQVTAKRSNHAYKKISVTTQNDDDAIAQSTRIRGFLRPSSKGPSFDAQLAEFLQGGRDIVRTYSLLGKTNVEPLTSPSKLPRKLTLYAPRNAQITNRANGQKISLSGATLTGSILMKYTNVPGNVLHRGVIKAYSGGATRGGDSGSPVLSKDGSIFVGMHIGSTRDGKYSIILPAWLLLNPAIYTANNDLEEWELVAV